MQFDVAVHRLKAEFGVPTTLEHLPYEYVRRTDAAGQKALQRERSVEVLTRVRDGALLALFANRWRLDMVAREHPQVRLEPLLADTGGGTRT